MILKDQAPQMVDYVALSGEEQEAVHAWLREHNVDPAQTPLDGFLGFDADTGEWRIKQFCRSPSGAHAYLVDGEIVFKVIRRRERRPLPWRRA